MMGGMNEWVNITCIQSHYPDLETVRKEIL